MSAPKPQLRKPQLREGVALSYTSNAVSVDYRDQGCEISFPDGARGELSAIMDALRSGARIADLAPLAPRLVDQIDQLLDELDRLGLLIERDVPQHKGGLSGAEFYRVARRFCERVKDKHARNEFYQSLVDGRATRDQVVGYAIEYYHVVRMAPGLIGPALAQSFSTRSQQLLQDFLAGELGHDRLLLRSLEAVGVSQRDLEFVQPLPCTFAICAALGVFAAQDPISFAASLFIYEDVDSRFAKALEDRAKALRLPREFIEPILEHADINDDSDHDAISKELLSEIAFIGQEQQNVTLKHLAVLVETLVNAESEILEYYSAVGTLPHQRTHGRLS